MEVVKHVTNCTAQPMQQRPAVKYDSIIIWTLTHVQWIHVQLGIMHVLDNRVYSQPITKHPTHVGYACSQSSCLGLNCMLQSSSLVCLHTTFYAAPPLAPLVDSLVACQRLTSLGLTWSNLSLQSFLAVVNGLHNLKALKLEGVSLSDEKVRDWVFAA